MVSIHASAKEATDIYEAAKPLLDVSIHASAKEATCYHGGNRPDSTGFNPRLREGGDRIRGNR